MRIVALDQIDLPLALIPLERLLALDRRRHALENFIPDKPLQSVLLCKPVDDALAVLPGALFEAAGHACVKRAVLPVAHHVDGDNGVAGNHG